MSVEVERRHRDAADDALRSALRPIFASVAAIYAAYALLDLVVQPPEVRLAMLVVDGSCAVVMALVWSVTARWPVPAGRAHMTFAALTGLAVVNAGASLVVTQDPVQTFGFVLVVMAAGIFLLSYRWTAAVLTASLAGWIASAVAAGFRPEWMQYGFTLVSACVLAGIAQVLRVRSFAKIEAARETEQASHVELERSRALYRSIVENSPNFIMQLDASGKILYLNRAPAGHIEDFLERRVTEFAPEAHRARVSEAIRKATVDGVASSFESGGPGAGGTTLTYECQMVPLPDAAGEKRVMFLALDVTEQRRAEEAQRVAYERLAEINRLKEVGELKTRLLNTASHELNTPITPLKLQIHLLKSARLGALNERQQKAVEMLDRNVERLAVLVQDVLDVARLQSGRLRLDRKATDVDRVVAEAVESFEEPARQSGITLSTSLGGGGEVHADPDRLTQVLFNLLANALKFTPEGGRIDVETERAKDRVVVRVRDTGVGLTGEQISRLFQPFGQVHDPDERTRAGTGLGLYISKGILEQHGGRIWCESPGPGKGATFAFAIPVEGAVLRRDRPGVPLRTG